MVNEKETRLSTRKKVEDNTDRNMRLEDALDGYWLARKRDFSPNTVVDYHRTFTRLCDFVGPDKAIEEISAGDIHDFLNRVQHRYRLGKKTLTARQLSARGGELVCEDHGERVRISGRAVTYMIGEIFI